MDRCYVITVTTRWQQYLLGCVQWLSAFSMTTEEEMVFLSATTFRNKLLYEKHHSSYYKDFYSCFSLLNEYLGKDEVMHRQAPFWSFP